MYNKENKYDELDIQLVLYFLKIKEKQKEPQSITTIQLFVNQFNLYYVTVYAIANIISNYTIINHKKDEYIEQWLNNQVIINREFSVDVKKTKNLIQERIGEYTTYIEDFSFNKKIHTEEEKEIYFKYINEKIVNLKKLFYSL